MAKVSIVLPTYNGSDFIKKSVDSIINQTFEDWELLIVNDCSTDNTLDIAKEYELKDSRIKVIDNKVNQKLPASLNIGFSEAKSEYLTWTSDDNYYAPNALEKMVKVLDDNKDTGFVYCNQYVVDEEDNIIYQNPQNNPNKIFNGCCIGACFMYTRSNLDQYGKYREDLFCAEDYEYWLRLYTAGVKFKHLPDFLYYYRNNPQSLTATKQNIVQLRTSEVKLEYWDKFKASNFSKCKSLFKQYKRTKSEELLLKIYEKSPIWGRVLHTIKK